MRFHRIAGNVFLVIYLWITLCAVLLTLFRVRILFPQDVVMYSYGMMAPYQRYEREHGELAAGGLRADGTWQSIDLKPYYPVMEGERLARQAVTAFYNYGTAEDRQAIRDAYARRLLILKREQGRSLTGVRLYWVQWPAADGPYDALKESNSERTLLSEQYVE